MKTVVIAQARMSSTRLPGKVLLDLGGRPAIDHVIRRASAAKLVDEVIVATTLDHTDDALVDHLEAVGVGYVRGSLENVLARYELAATRTCADVIVRITCDCPLIDPDVIDRVIEEFRRSPDVDYCCNTLRRTYPIGMDTEVFTREALARTHREASQPHEREHVTPYLYQHPELFRLRNVEAPVWANWPELRLTLDEPSDLDLLRAVFAELDEDAPLGQVLEFLRANPGLAAVNQAVAHRHVEKPTDW